MTVNCHRCRPAVIAVWLVGIVLAGPRAEAQTSDNVLLVVNGASADSVQIGEYYARKRRVAPGNVLRIEAPVQEEVTREIFDRRIEAPIATWLTRNAAQDRILYIVLTKGIPLRVGGTGGRGSTVASVDSELTLVYRKLTGRTVALPGHVPNPYFLGDRAVSDAKPFTHESFDIYLVTRLDAYTVADVIGLIDRGSAAVKSGRIALDERASLVRDPGNLLLERAADLLRRMGQGDRVVLETTSAVISNQTDLLGYYSWGSNDPAIRTRDQKLGFVPGALAATFVSTDARTFKEPPAAWTLGRWDDPKTFFGGAPQSLSGDLIRQGVTGVAGHVNEPYLDATIRPDVLFPTYLTGFNLAESFYLAMPYLSWQTVVIGDPLAAPFRSRTLSADEIDRGLDRVTELPTWFSARALDALGTSAARSDAGRLILKAKARLAHADMDGAREALEQATALDGRLVDAQLMLASLYEQAGNLDKAIERYRRIVTQEPGHVAALNNLAFALATARHDALPEALVFAQRANMLAPGRAYILDTLAWILHLSADDIGARAPMLGALRLSPNDPLLLMHAAVIEAAVGNTTAANTNLSRALTINPALQSRPEVQQLQKTLQPPPSP